jgi:hypothetical protein
MDAKEQALEYAPGQPRLWENRRWRRAALVVVAPIAALVLLVTALIVFDRPISILSTRYFFWKGGDWDVVEVTGYDEMPGFSVTGAVLTAKGRPDATVQIYFNRTWSPREGIQVINIGGLDIARVQARLLDDPRISDEQRRELRFNDGAVDVMDTGPFGNLFPHPIRDLRDLQTHYDEVHAVFRSIAEK